MDGELVERRPKEGVKIRGRRLSSKRLRETKRSRSPVRQNRDRHPPRESVAKV